MPYQPNPDSKRSQKRRNRGFVSLEVSSRKHKRAIRRQKEKCTFNNSTYKPGERVDGCGPNKRWMYVAGGSYKTH